jgi:hypothetical protein
LPEETPAVFATLLRTPTNDIAIYHYHLFFYHHTAKNKWEACFQIPSALAMATILEGYSFIYD